MTTTPRGFSAGRQSRKNMRSPSEYGEAFFDVEWVDGHESILLVEESIHDLVVSSV
jgi:hypothetical protein